MKNRIISKYLTPIFESKSSCAEWFGYYNYDTLNHDKTKMLCNHSNIEKPLIKSTDIIELGYYDLISGQWHYIDTTDSWNWQQGAMMQWIPGKGNENKVIYNSSKDGCLISKIKDLNTNEIKEINWPIYGITPDGKKSISIDLERSYWCRAYHYQSVINPLKEGRIIDGDGIFEIDLENNKRNLLIDIKTIVNLEPDADFDLMKHWVEHIMINPDGTKFCFLHRFSPQNKIEQYRTRICIANIDGSGLQVISGWGQFMWSHFGWKNINDFVIYTYKRPAIFKKFENNNQKNEFHSTFSIKKTLFKFVVSIKRRLPRWILLHIMPRNMYYQHYIFEKDSYKLLENLEEKYFNIDGHPSFTSDGRYMLTDSYPDGNNYRRYIVYDSITKKGMIIAKMPENKLNDNVECDLHPKLSKDNSYVVFDTTSSGKHSMILFKINWDLIKKSLS